MAHIVASIPTWSSHAASIQQKRPANRGKGSKYVGADDKLNQKISLFQGDLTTLGVNALVTSTDNDLMKANAGKDPVRRRQGTVDGAVHAAAGPKLAQECARLPSYKTGEVVITGGHNLHAKFVIHAVGPVKQKASLLHTCYQTSLEIVKQRGLRTVAFPCIATGLNGYPVKEATHVALQTIRRWLETGNNADTVDRIILCVYQLQDVPVYENLLYNFFPLEPYSTGVEDEEEYDLSLAPCGYVGKCVIFNIVQYKCDTYPTREGAGRDADRITDTFSRFGFNVLEMRDVTKQEILDYFGQLVETTDPAYRCFVCFVMAHGVEGDFVVDVNNELVDMDELTKKIDGKNCPKMAGKPKLFFAQMCRGMDQEEYKSFQHLYDSALAFKAAKEPDLPTLSPEQDKMVAYSTSKKKMSRRDMEGSEYIRELCDVLDKHGHDWDLSKVMRTVRRKITQLDPTNSGNFLCPEETNTLTKDFRFVLHYPQGPYNDTLQA